jgi:hypothetical protein
MMSFFEYAIGRPCFIKGFRFLDNLIDRPFQRKDSAFCRWFLTMRTTVTTEVTFCRMIVFVGFYK